MKTDVIFREFKGEILALFPYEVWNYKGDVACYSHIGQHSNADYNYVIQNSTCINEPYDLPLYSELENHVGYKLNVIKRRNYNKYIDLWHSDMNMRRI